MLFSRFTNCAPAQFTCFAFAMALLLVPHQIHASETDDIFGDAMEALADGNYEGARELTLPLAEAGNLLAKRLIGIIERKQHEQRQEAVAGVLENGRTLFKYERYDRALAVFRPLAEAGNAEALMYMGLIRRRQVKQEPAASEEALPYLEQAATKGFAWAKFLAAKANYRSRDPNSQERGDAWMIKAAHASIAEAYFPVSHMYCRRDEIDLGNAWAVINHSDAAFRRPAWEFEEHWEEVRKYWETAKCNASPAVTKEFVRSIHARAEALIETYNLRVCRRVFQCNKQGAPRY